MNLRGYVLCLCIMPFSFLALFGQGYVIDDYHVDIEIKLDGSALVLETIQVDFDEPRHGIYRDIPLGYKGKTASTASAIMISDVEVINDPFLIVNNPSMLRIRIGSANEKVRGNKQYKISYRVLGAVEQFDGVAEFAWNIIGDRWDTRIKKASATLTYPFAIKDINTDVLLNIKNREVNLIDLDYQVVGNQLQIEFPGNFRQRTGASLAIKFREHNFPIQTVPAAVLSEYYFVPRLNIEVKLDEQGVITVDESYRIIAKGSNGPLTRSISTLDIPSITYGQIYPYPDLMTANWNGDPKNITVHHQDYAYHFNILNTEAIAKSTLDLSYQINGAISSRDDKMRLHLDLASFDEKVAVDTISIEFELPPSVSIKTNEVMDGFVMQKGERTNMLYVRSNFLTGPIRKSFVVEGLNPENIVYVKENLYASKLIDDLSLNITQDKSGKINVNQSVLLQSKIPETNLSYFMGSRINISDFPFNIQNANLLNCNRELNIEVSEIHPDYRLQKGSQYQRAMIDRSTETSRFNASFQTDPILSDGQLIIPYYFTPETEIDHLSINVVNAKGELVTEIETSEYFMSGVKEVELINHEGYQFLAIPVGEGTLLRKGPSIVDRLRANSRLIGSLIIAGLLYLLWYRYGRDEKYDGSMHPHPPDYMTPAEAGYLWDGKLHGRDLISLIYHWAARGLLTIEEVDKSGSTNEYILEKQQDLPKDAFEYERILFDQLFSTGEHRVKISSLRNSFYKTMSTATKSLKSEFESRHMYEPFTRGMGTIFIILGFLIVIAGFVVLGIHSTHQDFSWSLPMLIIGMSMLFFGYYIPKKTALGSKYFIALQKFNKFIDEAPVSELSNLYEKDSLYFQNTLAYAIVLGKAKDWAKRFDGLITAPPTYYRGSRYNQFSPMLFTGDVMRGMRTMENDFYSTPAPPPSTSTYSGGRSSSFGGGGGFSGGGGFGGGGGSSW